MIEPIDLIVWDLETDGFVAPANKILEIGAFIIRGDSVEERRWVLHNKDSEGITIPVPEKITEINGMTTEKVIEEGRDPMECLMELIPLLNASKKNLTHNGINFDIPFLVAYATDVLVYNATEASLLRSHLRITACDTAVLFKGKKLGMYQGSCELFGAYGDRVMSQRVKGLLFNLGHCCDEHGIDRSNVVQHRALGDVELTYKLYQAICNK